MSKQYSTQEGVRCTAYLGGDAGGWEFAWKLKVGEPSAGTKSCVWQKLTAVAVEVQLQDFVPICTCASP